MNGVAACLFLGAPFCAVFYGVSRPNCYVPRHHVLSVIQATVMAVPDLSFVLCVLIGDVDPEGSNPRDIRGGGLWRINDAHCAYDPLILSCSTHMESPVGTRILLALPSRLWMS